MLPKLKRLARLRREQPKTRMSSTARRIVAERLTYLDLEKIQTVETCVREVQRHSVPGDFLETGVALGGSGILLASRMKGRRCFHGYDVFGTIPPPTEADPPPVHERYRTIVEGRSEGIGGDTYYGYIDDLYERVVANFARYGQTVDGRRVTLHRGLFDDTLHPRSPVALVHVDCDWYEPVKLCIERIWPQLSSGGLMIFDDYNDYGGCTRAVDEFVGERPGAELRQSTPSAVVVKA